MNDGRPFKRTKRDGSGLGADDSACDSSARADAKTRTPDGHGERRNFEDRIRRHLSRGYARHDSIHDCGSAALSILSDRPEEVQRLAHERLHAFPFSEVPECWRRLYTEATLWSLTRLRCEDWVTEATGRLDMAVILTGAPRREAVFQELWASLQQAVEAAHGGDASSSLDVPCEESPRLAAARALRLRHPLPETDALSLPQFESRVNSDLSPFIIHDSLSHWPALSEPDRAWANTNNLLRRTLGGRRLVPVELGSKYTDEDWGQQILPFRTFLTQYMLRDPTGPVEQRRIGYLAQHDLFRQIPALRSDIAVPDYCYARITAHEPAGSELCKGGKGAAYDGENGGPRGESDGDEDEDEAHTEVMLNAWFGPAHTVSPLHTDPHHNVLAQVVGSKYVRLYAAGEGERLYPRGAEGEVDMSNTSQIDLDLAVRLLEGRSLEVGTVGADGDGLGGGDEAGPVEESELEKARDEFETRFPLFGEARYLEGVLRPGDCLFIPRGWWHYVRSLSASCSVSFWWD